MAFPLFRSWWPTAAASWHVTGWLPKQIKIIVNNRTGAPVGLQSQNANGPDGIWGLTPVTPAQAAAPDTYMLQDLQATYQLDQAPYSRYRSDGVQFVPLDGESGTIVPPGVNVMWVSPLTIFQSNPLTIEGGVILVSGV